MPLNLLPVSQARKELSAILRRLQETGEPVFLTRAGQAACTATIEQEARS